MEMEYFAHPTADVSPEAEVGVNTRIWRYSCVREHARIGANCNLGQSVYIDNHTWIGSCVKIENNVSIFEGVRIEDGVFVGPHVTFTNDLFPRAITPDGKLKNAEDWTVTSTLVRAGASIGAGSVIRCGVTIGEFALIGAGSVVTTDVPAQALVFGNPARPHGYVCRCAHRLQDVRDREGILGGWCPNCEKWSEIGAIRLEVMP